MVVFVRFVFVFLEIASINFKRSLFDLKYVDIVTASRVCTPVIVEIVNMGIYVLII